MICKNCGKRIGDTDKYCPECGTAQYGKRESNIPQKSEDKLPERFREVVKTILTASIIMLIFGIIIRQPRIMVIAAISSLITFFLIRINKR
ncbi:zinc-ribbon domain-containing protein [Sedimentisphaera salicampi]|uniref:Putative membrane protein n=1 Tax=Sedimentisphaera salicampi TaxID=1941349 RepID=A0A1W6LNA6_9BACT|nr:zinc ribbon domain-containing protein [Sedimentisphaera salicampi]ARN57257.1 putative membrane protein [Sedimentisphaera salicampi]OXU14697.1 putative membrane protein [Sedimentisphaera salicampi]